MTHWFNEFCPFTEILDIQFILKVTFLFEATAGKCWVETSGLVTSIQIFGWSNTRSGPSHSAHVSKFNKTPFLCFTFCHSITSRFLHWEDLLSFYFVEMYRSLLRNKCFFSDSSIFKGLSLGYTLKYHCL